MAKRTNGDSPVRTLVAILLGMSPDEGQTVVDMLQGIVDHRREQYARAEKAMRADARPQPLLVGKPAADIRLAASFPQPTLPTSAATPAPKRGRGRPPKAGGAKRVRPARAPKAAMKPAPQDVALPMGAGEDFPTEGPIIGQG